MTVVVDRGGFWPPEGPESSTINNSRRAVRVHPLAVVLSVAAGGLIAGVGGAVVAVPLVAVANTVVGYLHAHSREAALRQVLTAGVPHPVEPEDDPEGSGRTDGVEAAAGSED